MSSVNKVILVGRLGADPEIRYTQSGQPVGSLRLATSENWNDRDGNRQERTEWHSVTVWGKQAELCGQYLAKGRQVYIEGRLQSREYTDREGVNKRAWDVVASQIVFLGGRGESGGWGGNQQGGGNQGGGWGGNQQGGGNPGGGGGGNQEGGGTQGGGWGGNHQPGAGPH
ncbi:MAG: single-stranded DNA-binding protein, partial [Myxococcota bacterium]|nr:single-stranded DNA-binding protein [Myxococcota bacterium]